MWSNKAAGNAFERAFARELAENHFWVHRFQDKASGQPCDIVAARDGRTFLFDCKDCRRGYFDLSRMEENQLNAMQLFRETGNSRGMFALQFPDGLIVAPYDQLRSLRRVGRKKLDFSTASVVGMHLGEWLLRTDKEKTDGDFDWE